MSGAAAPEFHARRINSAAAWENESGLTEEPSVTPVVGSEQGGVRPVLIIQNDTGNRYSPTVIAAAITSQTGKARLPTHIDLPVDQSCGLSRDSIVLLEQVRTLDKKRLRERMGHVEEAVMEKVDFAIAVSFGLSHDQMV